ncbi:hypothetical protein [Actinomadura sp. 9N215]|uniref:hypothetical protein n=1 Tax=Actinomadura sp. 9N215 TaxID=3375150 RepID=UPI003798AB56
MQNRIESSDPCPAWCAGIHPVGGVHRVEVGSVTVDGKGVRVVVLQTPSHTPSVVISGAVYVAVHEEDHEDMAELLTMCGQPALADLVRRAAQIMNDEVLKDDSAGGAR